MRTLDLTLIVDRPEASASLAEGLRRCGCRVTTVVRNGAPPGEGLTDPHAPLLFHVPRDATGALAWIRDLRARRPDARLCALFEQADETTQAVALEVGADAVLCGRVDARRLAAQLRALDRLRRPAAPGRVELRPGSRAARLNGRALDLTDSEYDLLRLLVLHAGRALDRDEIKRAIRGLPHDARDRSIDLMVVRLRRKLGDDPQRPRYIRTVRGVGYMFMNHAS